MLLGLSAIGELLELAQSAEREGDLDAALYHYEQAFTNLAQDPSRAAPLLRWIGRVHRSRGDLELAEEAYLASDAIAAATSNTADLASALNCLAIVAQVRARIEEATELYNQARDLAGISDDGHLAAMIDQNLGTLANTIGDFNGAIQSYRSAYNRFEALG